MIYKQYTITTGRELPTFFKCPCCGKITFTNHALKVKTSYNDKNTLSKKQVEKRKSEAVKDGLQQQKELYEKVLAEAKNGKYRAAKYVCKCAQCGHKPLWARLSYRVATSITNLVLVIGIFLICFLALACLDKDYDSAMNIFVKFILPCVGVFVLTKVIVLIHRTNIEKKITEMDKAYLPIICRTKKEIDVNYQRMQEVNEKGDV